MALSLICLTAGFLLMIVGAVLFILKKQRMVAVVCLVVGVLLIIVPPILIMMSPM